MKVLVWLVKWTRWLRLHSLTKQLVLDIATSLHFLQTLILSAISKTINGIRVNIILFELLRKVERVYPMVIVSLLPYTKFGRKDHREDAPHFICPWKILKIFPEIDKSYHQWSDLLPRPDHLISDIEIWLSEKRLHQMSFFSVVFHLYPYPYHPWKGFQIFGF